VLDTQEVPCTWFIEAGKETQRDLPRLFPDILRGLAGRKRDEIGLHVHWRRHRGGSGTVVYETADSDWVRDQVAHGLASLRSLGIQPSAFRSGALLFVEGLPGILEDFSFQTDSSTLWSKANRIRGSIEWGHSRSALKRLKSAVRKVFSFPSQPYFTDSTNVEKAGSSTLLEFPIFSGLLESRRPIHAFVRHLTLLRASLASNATFLTFFFHIDELLDRRSGPNDSAVVDMNIVRFLSDIIATLRDRGNTAFLSMSEARDCFIRNSLQR
jgi:hypothetical protein